MKRLSLPVEPKLTVGTHISGPTSSLFIDWHGYPEVALGPSIDLNPDFDGKTTEPKDWYGMSFDELIALRTHSVQTSTVLDVTTQNKFIENLQQLAISEKPFEAELHLREKPAHALSFSAVHEPLGLAGELEYIKLVGNPIIPRSVDREISEGSNPRDAVWRLYNEGFDVYYLQRLFASGMLNKGNGLTLIPTNWSIRAVDKLIGNNLINEIDNFEPVDEIHTYSISYLSNKYEILLSPGEWKFELFEGWAPDTLWTLAFARPVIHQDFEGYTVGTDNVENSNGSYHAIRLAVLEGLKKLGKSATAVVFREVDNDYRLPMGVWHVREAVRHAFNNEPGRFENIEAALKNISRRLHTPLSDYTRHGVILRQNWMGKSLINT